jgi:hypothetical protein
MEGFGKIRRELNAMPPKIGKFSTRDDPTLAID